MMNRAQRRAAKKSAPRKKPAWHGLTKEQKKEALFRNGITAKDLEKSYEDGRKRATADYVGYAMPFFYSAAAIAAHRNFGFGAERIRRLLDDIQQIMSEEICSEDILERCKRETGIDILFDGYDN